MNKLLLLLLAATLVACETKPVPPIIDAGEEDAGVDAGPVDAGRGKGHSRPMATPVRRAPMGNGPTVRMGVSASMALDQFGHPMIAGVYTDPNNDTSASTTGWFSPVGTGSPRRPTAGRRLPAADDDRLDWPNRSR